MDQISKPLTRRKRISDAQILEAATREFVAAGYQAARVDRIAESARITKRTLYVRFESKEALFRSALAFEARELGRRLIEVYGTDMDSSLPERLHEYVHAYFAYAADRPDGFQLLFLDEQAASENDLRQILIHRIARLVADCLGTDPPTPEHHLIAALIVAVTHNGAGNAVAHGMDLAHAASTTERFLGYALGGFIIANGAAPQTRTGAHTADR